MAAVDALFDVRTNLYLGNFQGCVNEAQKANVDADLDDERRAFMYRALVAQRKFAMVTGDIKSDAPSVLQAVKRLAVYLQRPAERDSIVADVIKMKDDGISMNDPLVAVLSATVLAQAQKHEDALRCLHQSETLETLAMSVQTLLKMNRVDVARKELKKMQGIDEDSILTLLSAAYVNLHLGGEKIQDALYTFQELADKFGPTPLLLNGQASALMLQNKFDEAEDVIQTAMDKDPNDPETLVNSIAVAIHSGKHDHATRYINQLKDSTPDHPFVRDLVAKEQEFETLAQQQA